MSELWKELRAGDRVCIREMPPEFDSPGYYVDPETRLVYEALVRGGEYFRIDNIDDDGLPWIQVILTDSQTGEEERHYLALNHGGIERVRSKN